MSVNETTGLISGSSSYYGDGEKRAWEKYNKWAHLADRKNNVMYTARVGVLSLTVTGAILQAFGTLFVEANPIGKTLSIIGGIFIGAVPFISQMFLTKQHVHDRVNSRLVAELVKAEVYKAIARADQYNKDNYGRDQQFETALKDIITKVQPSKKLQNQISFSTFDTSTFEQDLISELEKYPTNRDFYLSARVDDQIKWLHKSSSNFYERSQWLSKAEAILSFVSGGIGVGGGSLGLENILGVWVSVIATAATAVTAHIHVMQYDAKATKYQSAKKELESAKRKYLGDDESWHQLVLDCEHILESLNESWSVQIRGTPLVTIVHGTDNNNQTQVANEDVNQAANPGRARRFRFKNNKNSTQNKLPSTRGLAGSYRSSGTINTSTSEV